MMRLCLWLAAAAASGGRPEGSGGTCCSGQVPDRDISGRDGTMRWGRGARGGAGGMTQRLPRGGLDLRHAKEIYLHITNWRLHHILRNVPAVILLLQILLVVPFIE